jgi:hypothetical protein
MDSRHKGYETSLKQYYKIASLEELHRHWQAFAFSALLQDGLPLRTAMPEDGGRIAGRLNHRRNMTELSFIPHGRRAPTVSASIDAQMTRPAWLPCPQRRRIPELISSKKVAKISWRAHCSNDVPIIFSTVSHAFL